MSGSHLYKYPGYVQDHNDEIEDDDMGCLYTSFENIRSKYFNQILNNEDMKIDFTAIPSKPHAYGIRYSNEIFRHVSLYGIIAACKETFPEIHTVIPQIDFQQNCKNWYTQFLKTPKIIQTVVSYKMKPSDINIIYPVLCIVVNMTEFSIASVFSSIVVTNGLLNSFDDNDTERILKYVYPSPYIIDIKDVLQMYEKYGDTIHHKVYWNYFKDAFIFTYICDDRYNDLDMIRIKQIACLYDKLHSLNSLYKIPHRCISVYKTIVANNEQYDKIRHNMRQAIHYLSLDSEQQLEIIQKSDTISKEYSVMYIFWNNFIQNMTDHNEYDQIVSHLPKKFLESMSTNIETHKKYIEYIYTETKTYIYDQMSDSMINEIANYINVISKV
jgi:hypothetical protein